MVTAGLSKLMQLEQLWNKTYNLGTSQTSIFSLVQTSDGGYALVGSTVSANTNWNYVGVIVKIDATGSTQWTQALAQYNQNISAIQAEIP